MRVKVEFKQIAGTKGTLSLHLGTVNFSQMYLSQAIQQVLPPKTPLEIKGLDIFCEKMLGVGEIPFSINLDGARYMIIFREVNNPQEYAEEFQRVVTTIRNLLEKLCPAIETSYTIEL